MLDKSKYILKPGKNGMKRWHHIETGQEIPEVHKTGDKVQLYHSKYGAHTGTVISNRHFHLEPKVLARVTSDVNGQTIEMDQNNVHKYDGKTKMDFSSAPNSSNTAKREVADKLAEDLSSGDEHEAELKDINQKYETFGRLVKMVGRGIGKSLIAYGTGGVGKTYEVIKQMNTLGLTEFDEDEHLPANLSQEEADEADDEVVLSQNYDYVKITGKSTAAGMYKDLYQHNGKLIIYDDCDSVLKDANAINILKGALDSSGDNTISWSSLGKIEDDLGNPLPRRFKFGGRVIFISNLPSSEIPQPIKSRAYRIDLTMSKQQTIDRLRHIMGAVQTKLKGVTEKDKTEVIDLLEKYKDKLSDLNTRTLLNILAIKKNSEAEGVNWQVEAKHMLFSN